ncbi:MAG: DMT family transporter [Saprospiraceae bacterium]|nr:DMT family transporter [Saprospiraceae bacterium]
MNHTFTRSYLYVHLAVFLFGFTGVLGFVIDLPAVILVWWRSLLTWVMMLPWMIHVRMFSNLTTKDFKIFGSIGVIVALHWICFYGSIKLANASIAMICLSTISVMTAFMEAWLQKRPVLWKDALIGLAIIPGIILINGNISGDYRIGFLVGMLAAAFSALFASLNKKYILNSEPLVITWVELLSVWLFISLILPFMYLSDPNLKFYPSQMDWLYLLILALFCTVIPYALALQSMKKLSAFSAMLAFNMETVYGILLSILILKEHKEMNAWFYLGVLLILSSVFLHPLINRDRKSPDLQNK